MTEPANAPPGLRVLVMGDAAIMRRGVAQYLRLTLSSVTVGEASSASEVSDMVRASAWDLIVVDLAGTGDLGRLAHLKYTAPDVPVWVLNGDPAPAKAKAAFAAGAAGYLSRGSAASQWRNAVEIVARGGKYPGVTGAEQDYSQ